MSEKVSSHTAKCRSSAHRIVAATAVDVHVNESGTDERQGPTRIVVFLQLQ